MWSGRSSTTSNFSVEASPPYTLHAASQLRALPPSMEVVMSLMSEIFSGYARRIRLENALTLQRAQLVRPAQITLEIASTLNAIDEQLATDAKLKAKFDTIKLTIPE